MIFYMELLNVSPGSQIHCNPGKCRNYIFVLFPVRVEAVWSTKLTFLLCSNGETVFPPSILHFSFSWKTPCALWAGMSSQSEKQTSGCCNVSTMTDIKMKAGTGFSPVTCQPLSNVCFSLWGALVLCRRSSWTGTSASCRRTWSSCVRRRWTSRLSSASRKVTARSLCRKNSITAMKGDFLSKPPAVFLAAVSPVTMTTWESP